MDELIAFLRARLAEDEQAARAATAGPWEWRHEHGELWQPKPDGWLDYSGEYIAGPGDRATLFGPGMTPHADAVHVARHDPARVLADIEAKKQTISTLLSAKHAVCEDSWYTCPAATEERDGGECGQDDMRGEPCECGRDDRLITHLCLLALPYADHPEYDEAWRP